MHVKKGDTVVVLSGDDKGKKGTIVKAMPEDGRVVVEGVNVHKRHERARRAGAVGQVVEKAFPIRACKVKKVS